MTLREHAERLTDQWAASRLTEAQPFERDLTRFVLEALAHAPTEDELVEEIVRRRWTARASS